MSAQMSSRLASPVPNHSAMSGASARMGVACAATMYGESRRDARLERASRTPGEDAGQPTDEKAEQDLGQRRQEVRTDDALQPTGQKRSATTSGPGRMKRG